MNNQDMVNQTQFSFEEPIFEDAQVYADETQPKEVQPPVNNKKKKILIIAGIVGFLFILLLLLLVVVRARKAVTPTDDPVKQVEETKNDDPIQDRIDDARDLLEEADPTKQDLSFPPVDMDLRLDPKEK